MSITEIGCPIAYSFLPFLISEQLDEETIICIAKFGVLFLETIL